MTDDLGISQQKKERDALLFLFDYANPNFFCRSIATRLSARWIAESFLFLLLIGRPVNRRARVSRKIPLRFTRRVKLYNSEFPCSPSFFRTSIAMMVMR